MVGKDAHFDKDAHFESVSDHHIIVVSMCVVVALVLVNVVHKLGTKVYCRCIPMAQKRIQIFQ